MDGLARIFGQLPDAFLQAVGAGPLRVKTAVDLDLAQRFVDSIKAIGGQVEMVRTGAPPPGQALTPGSTGTHPSVAGYAAGRGQRVRHRSLTDRGVPTGPQTPVGAPATATGSAAVGAQATGTFSQVDARPDFHPGLRRAPTGAVAPVDATAAEEHLPATGLFPAATGEMLQEEEEPQPEPILEVPQVFVAIEPVHPNHPLRGSEHLANLHPLQSLADVAAPFDQKLSLGVLGAANLDPLVGDYIAKQLHLSEPVELYFTEAPNEEVKGVTGVVVTARSVAWREAKIPLSRLDAVALQADQQERPWVEIAAAGEIFALPLLDAVPTVILAETLARISPRKQLWAGPRAVRRLRTVLAQTMGRFTRTALSRTDEGHPARRAIGMVRYYYDMIMRLHDHWEHHPISRWGSARQIPMSEIVSTVIALEFLEIRDRLSQDTSVMINEMLTGAQNILQNDEGVLALFEFRDPRWEPPVDLDPLTAGNLSLLNYGLPSRELLRKASRDNYLLGTHGVLTNRRLVFVRPGGKSAAAEISLGKIDDIAVQDGRSPRLHIKYLGAFDGRETLRYACSGNYLYPVAGTPLAQLQRLAARILEAQERFWESQQPPPSEAAKLPSPPVWLGEALAQTARVALDRMMAASVALMRDPSTPREVRRVAMLGHQIPLTALRPLREKAASAKVPLSGLGERVLFIPGEIFDRDDDGIYVSEGGLLVSGFGIGRLGWRDIRRIETVNDGSWTAALIGGTHEEVGIRSKNEELILWLGTLVSTLVHAADVQ